MMMMLIFTGVVNRCATRLALLACIIVHLTLVNVSQSSLPHHLHRALHDCASSELVGLSTGHIKDWQISASSTFPSSNCHERFARLHLHNGLSWCARYKAPTEWLQLDLGLPAKVTGVMTQGRSDGAEWVTSFMMSYSVDAFHWQYVRDQYDNQRVFEGNVDSYSVKHSYLDEPIIARFVKFHVIHWNQHPSMRVELVGCQVCKTSLALPPYSKVSASSQRAVRGRGGSRSTSQRHSCQADDAYIFTGKAWCAKRDDANQWLQFDIGPPTLVTGVVTRGRGDGRRKHWVTRFRLSYSNNTDGPWLYYKDAPHLHNKEFGGNVDKDIERVHYLNWPFIARYVRFHPLSWHRHISMRAGLIGCPFTGECGEGFMRVNDYTPCVANVAYRKESFVSLRRGQQKRRSTAVSRSSQRLTIDGQTDQTEGSSCTVISSVYTAGRPVWVVDLQRDTHVSGLVIVTRPPPRHLAVKRDVYSHNLDKLAVYVVSGAAGDVQSSPDKTCGFVTRLNGALFRPRLHVQCTRRLHGRYVYIEAWGVASRLYSAVLCQVMIYE